MSSYNTCQYNPQARGRRYNYFAMRYSLAKRQVDHTEHAHIAREEARPQTYMEDLIYNEDRAFPS
jgi:hypothetical protein